MPYIVLASRLSFQKTKPDSPTEPDGAEEIVERGQMVPDYAPAFLIGALSSSGLIVWAEDRRPDLAPFDTLPPQVRTADMPPVLPSDPNGTPPLMSDLLGAPPADEVPVDVVPVDERQPETAPLSALPKDADKKEVWEAYASQPQIGMTLAEAESMNKTDLVTEVKRRHAVATK